MSQKVTRMIATPMSLNVESPGRTDLNKLFSVLSSDVLHPTHQITLAFNSSQQLIILF